MTSSGWLFWERSRDRAPENDKLTVAFKLRRDRKGNTVQARPRSVAVFETTSDAVPFDDWMRDLKDLTGRAAIEARIGLLRRGSLGKSIATWAMG